MNDNYGTLKLYLDTFFSLTLKQYKNADQKVQTRLC